MKPLIVALTLLLSGCALMQSQASREEKLALIELARLHLTSSGTLSEIESHAVRTESPRVSYYFMGRPYGDYRLEWKLPAGGKIIIVGRGDVLRLENPQIIREPNQPSQRNASTGPISNFESPARRGLTRDRSAKDEARDTTFLCLFATLLCQLSVSRKSEAAFRRKA